MATENQINANRLNAQKCTGPITPEGKARSSQNALRTGIDSKAELLPTENRDAYVQLIEAFNNQFAPASPAEQSVVDDLIRCEWMSRRYMAIEAATWESRHSVMKEPDLGYAFLSRSEVFARAGQLYRATRRSFSAAMKELRLLRAERRSGEAPAQSFNEPAPTATVQTKPAEPLTPKLVSFLEFHFEPEITPAPPCPNPIWPPKAA